MKKRAVTGNQNSNSLKQPNQIWFNLKVLLLGCLVCFVLLIIIIILYSFAYQAQPQQKEYGYFFDESVVFDLDTHCQTVEISSLNKILILTDLHFYGLGDYKSKQTIKNIVSSVKPELIFILGDLCFTPRNLKAYRDLVVLFDSFKIPWAPIFGNHDNFGPASKEVLSDVLAESIYCLYQYGPSNYEGGGNYCLNISIDDIIVHSFILFDSHTQALSANPSLVDIQIKWYQFIINGLKNTVDSNIETTILIHVPINEYVDAYTSGTIIFGEMREKQSIPSVNTGIFTVIKNLGSTKTIICGHDHLNNYYALYEGILFVYAQKTCTGSYYDKDFLGYMCAVINNDGSLDLTTTIL